MFCRTLMFRRWNCWFVNSWSLYNCVSGFGIKISQKTCKKRQFKTVLNVGLLFIKTFRNLSWRKCVVFGKRPRSNCQMCSIHRFRKDEKLGDVITSRKYPPKIEYNRSSRRNEYVNFATVRVTEQQRCWELLLLSYWIFTSNHHCFNIQFYY